MIRKVFSSVWALMPLAVSMVSLGSAWADTPGTIAKFDDQGNPFADSVITEGPTTGNIGIGTTPDPNQKLALEADVPTFNGTSIQLFNRAGGNTNRWVLGTGGCCVAPDSFSIGDSSDYRMVLNSSGMLVFGRSGTTGKLLIDSNTPEFVIPYSFEINNHTGNGRGRSYGWDTFSSRRWKANIQPIRGALEKVERLRGVSFDWKKMGKHDIGLIAEEVGEVVPEVVTYEKNGKDALGVEYARLTALLIEATKEQQSQIRELKAELKGLKTLEQPTAGLKEKDAEIADLNARLDTLEGMVKSVAYVTTWNERTE